MLKNPLLVWEWVKKQNVKRVINDPLGRTHSLAISDHYFHLKLGLYWEILKSGDGQTCKNNDRYCGSAAWINREDDAKVNP